MSDKTKSDKSTPEVLDEHGDELIHVPTGQSRLRYLATIGLVLFLLVIFVVADLFQGTMTGGGGRTDEVYMTWTDPVDQSEQSVTESEFFETARFLSTMNAFSVYAPDSLLFGEPDPNRRRRGEPEESDVASFIIYEKIAKDAGVAVSDDEHKAFLRGRFGSKEGLLGAAAQARMGAAEVADGARRVERVSKLRGLMLTALGIPDPAAVVKTWAESRPEFKFEAVSVNREDFIATAESETPDDETLTTWFRERPEFEQRRLWSEERVVAKVAYLDLDGEVDTTALLEAFPAPEGVDLDQQAQSYFSQFRTTRFRVPEEVQASLPSEEGEADAPKKLFYDFEDVEAQVRAEAPVHAALSDFVTSLQDRAAEGEEIDLQREAEGLGLSVIAMDEAGMTRQEMTEAEIWGSPQVASQLAFSEAGSVIPRVTATESGLVLGQVTKKIERAEPPFEDIRDDVAKSWAEERAAELAIESLDYLRQTLATKPEDVELADWQPEISWDDLRKGAGEAGYTVYDRPWLERSQFPEGQTFQTAGPVDKYITISPMLYDMEEGTVGPAAKSTDGSQAFLVRFGGQREKDTSEIDAGTVLNLRRQTAGQQQRDFGA
ncbi:MAG: hypothetical protein AAGG01_17910, partial [Planctomycetota bacterium]